MRVLLVSLNQLTVPYPVYPLGVDHVAGAIAGSHELLTLDLLEADLERLAAVAERFEPRVVGLSIRNIDSSDIADPGGFEPAMRRAASAARAAAPGAKIVLGGSGFSLFPERLMGLLEADYGVVGDGEHFGALLQALERGDDPRGLPNVVARGDPPPGRRSPWRSDPRAASGAGPDRAPYLARGGMLNLQTKRGCPFRCSYCTYPLIEGSRLQLFDPVRAARAARALQEAGARFLYVVDAVFNAHVEHGLAFAAALREARVALPWGAMFSPRPTPPGYYERLVAAGLTHVELGTEALNDPLLASFRKPFSLDQALAAHRAARGAGAHVAHYLLLGGPGETRATVEQTLDQAEALEGAALFFFCGVRVYPGTELCEVARSEGQIDEATDLLQPTFYSAPAISSREIESLVEERAAGRRGWVVGSGGQRIAGALERMYERGRSGPLWEKLVG